MPRIYISPTVGRSDDLPEKYRQYFSHEVCEYRSTCPTRLLEGGGDIPHNFGESLKNGREIVKETIVNIFGEEEEFTRWDHEGLRYYVDVDDLDDLEALILATGCRIILERRSTESEFDCEYMEMIYGFPEIEGWTAELETERVPLFDYDVEEQEEEEEEDEEDLEGEGWKKL